MKINPRTTPPAHQPIHPANYSTGQKKNFTFLFSPPLRAGTMAARWGGGGIDGRSLAGGPSFAATRTAAGDGGRRTPGGERASDMVTSPRLSHSSPEGKPFRSQLCGIWSIILQNVFYLCLILYSILCLILCLFCMILPHSIQFRKLMRWVGFPEGNDGFEKRTVSESAQNVFGCLFDTLLPAFSSPHSKPHKWGPLCHLGVSSGED